MTKPKRHYLRIILRPACIDEERGESINSYKTILVEIPESAMDGYYVTGVEWEPVVSAPRKKEGVR